MIRISKLTDYGVLLLTYFAREPERVLTARILATEIKVPQTTVSKVLHNLSRAGILTSERGVGGGYRLADAPENISVADVIWALEGPVAITDCCISVDECDLHTTCPVGGHWQKINQVVKNALESITLKDLRHPLFATAELTNEKLIPVSIAGRDFP